MTTPQKFSPTNAIDLLLDCICAVDADGRFVYVSAASTTLFGYAPEEMIGQAMTKFIHPKDLDHTLEVANKVMKGKAAIGFENRYVRKDGSIVHILWSARWDDASELRIALAHDITERKQHETKQNAVYAISSAAQSTYDLEELFPKVHDIVAKLISADNFFIALYDGANDILSFPYFIDQKDSAPEPMPLDSGTLSAQVIRSGAPLIVNSSNQEAIFSGSCKPVGSEAKEWVGVPLATEGQVIGVLVVQSYCDEIHYSEQDISLLQFVSTQIACAIERTQLHEQLLYAAGHDPLTGLANRGLFQDRLHSILTRVTREHARFAVLYLDLNNFKLINDQYGHGVGDQLLQQVAIRLKDCIRESDTIARIGGDEFVILLDTIQLPNDAANVSRKIQSKLNSSFLIDEHKIRITPSIGIAVYPEDGDNEVELLRAADEAMYRSKPQ
ncbi:MAG: diguanylate cyclase [Pseudohongiellaceae bacterium]|nr:diguanylate cyclase [Pseudohongiellaceae bacterium]